MSDNFLRLIPIDPNFVPDVESGRRARDLLASFVPQSDEVTVSVFEAIQFIDPGGNFERVLCPSCRKEINIRWWQQAMNGAYETNFNNLTITTPCCGVLTSLNELRYEWPAGFARFELEARNPGVRDLPEQRIHLLEKVLGCELRKIWAHY